MNAPGQVAELDHGLLGLLVGLLHEGPGGRRVAVELLLGHAEGHGQGHEALLGAVVEVTLDAAPLGVDDVDELLPAGPQLADPGGQGGPPRRAAEGDGPAGLRASHRAQASVTPSRASAPTTVKLSASEARTRAKTSAPIAPTTIPSTA